MFLLLERASKTVIDLGGKDGVIMSNFLQMLPRRLPVALADYVAVTGENELQRCAIARRIYAALPTEQQAETSRVYEAMSTNVSHACFDMADATATSMKPDIGPKFLAPVRNVCPPFQRR